MAQNPMDSDRLSSAGISTHSSGTVGTVNGSVIGAREAAHKRDEEEEYNLGPLPPMWEKAYTPTGEVYFIDHNCGTSHWLDPRLARVRKHSLGECGEDELPYGWERVTDERYGSYYVDHINRRTQYENPVIQARRIRGMKHAEGVAAPQSEGSAAGGDLHGDHHGSMHGDLHGDHHGSMHGEIHHGPIHGDIHGNHHGPIHGDIHGNHHGPMHADIHGNHHGSINGDIHGNHHGPMHGDIHRDPRGDLHGDHRGEMHGDIRGETFLVTLTKGTQGLGFTLIGAEGVPETEGYLQIRSIVPHSPAWIDGALQPGDVLTGVGGRGVRGLAHAQVAQLFQGIAPGTRVALHVRRGYPLPFDSEDPNTRVLSTRAVDGAPDAAAMQQLTRALRSRFNLESPAAEAGGGRDEPDASPAPHSPQQRRLLSRSFDLDEIPTNGEQNPEPPRCPSADHLLSIAPDASRSRLGGGAGRELVLALRRGGGGFGFTIADSVHGQKVKKVLDRSRCAGLREGDLLLQIGEHDVRHAPHQHVVQVLKECPALHETILRVWRRAAPRPPRSRSATRQPPQPTTPAAARSKTPTGEQLRALAHAAPRPRPDSAMDTEATYAVPEHKRESLLERRRRSSTPGGRLTVPPTWADGRAGWAEGAGGAGGGWPQDSECWEQAKWHASPSGQPAQHHQQPYLNNNGGGGGGGEAAWRGERWGYGEAATPTVRVDAAAGYWRAASVADSSDNGGFPEEGVPHSPATHAVSALCQSPRCRSPAASSGRVLSASPAGGALAPSPSGGGPKEGGRLSPGYDELPPANGFVANYPQVEVGGGADPEADVLVRLARGDAGFGFRIVGGTEDGTRVAVGLVVPGGPADGLLRPGDLLTSVDGAPLAGASHARAVLHVCRAARRGRVTLGVRHNRADVAPLAAPAPLADNHNAPSEALHHAPPASYSILHPAPMYPQGQMYGGGYEAGGWAAAPYDVTVSRGDGEGFGFVVISSTNKATSTIGQLIPNSPAARSGLLQVGDTILAINRAPIRNLPHPEVVALIKRSGRSVTLTVDRRPE